MNYHSPLDQFNRIKKVYTPDKTKDLITFELRATITIGVNESFRHTEFAEFFNDAAMALKLTGAKVERICSLIIKEESFCGSRTEKMMHENEGRN